jgi:hypothetical protein
MAVFRAGLDAALAEAGGADQARAEVERLTAGDLAAVPRDPAWGFSLAILALACYHLGEAEIAVKLRERLEPYADRNIVTGRVGAICLGPAASFLGLLDLTLGRPGQALRSFQQATALADRMQTRPMAAMSREGQARALRRNPAIAALIDADAEPATGEPPGQARQPAPPRPRKTCESARVPSG